MLYGPLSGTSSLADHVEIPQTFSGDGLGGDVDGAGDSDGDGRLELLIGATGDDFAGEQAGAAYLLEP